VGQEPSRALPMWAWAAPGHRADRGDAGRRVSAEEATEPHSQRKATAARSKTQGPPRTVVSHDRI
jgi:hypothetical protein